MPPPNELPGLGHKSLAMLAAARQNASLNLLWAMEGALTGKHWCTVAREHRTRLPLALELAQRPKP
jgi:DNA transformation protein and related proteins